MKDNYLNGKVPNGVSGVIDGKPVTKGGGNKGVLVEAGIGSTKSGSVPKEGKKSISGK
ncbi:MAG: hypothetical protein LBN43_06300 [Oscillospiraceae bacterium]|jgi:hypothetical protein|nr:hypothetical protein [Oscillospiraceae bacterium]